MTTSTTDIDRPVYLRTESKLDALINNWYAWPHLLSPVQCAMNVAFRQLPVLQSFIVTPDLHLAAASDPEMFSGPFVHLPAEQIDAAKNLYDRTRVEMVDLLRFADSVKEFSQQLTSQAGGLCLTDFYAQLPASLKGLVELVYTADAHPTLRFIEELCYGSEIDTRKYESIALSLSGENERTFFMNTPFLPEAGRIVLDLRFDDSRVDMLAKLRTEAAPLRWIGEQLGVAPAMLEKFFTEEAPRRTSPEHLGPGTRVRYLGHACVLIQAHGKSILIDPVVAWDPSGNPDKFTFSDLPDVIDFVVITHGHQDHLCAEVLLQLRHRVRTVLVPRNNGGSIFDPSLKLMFKRLGFSDVRVLEPFDAVDIPGGKITGLPFIGEHADLDIYAKQSVYIEIDGRTILLVADSDAVDADLCKRISHKMGRKIDILFIGMECYGAPLSWLYGPLMTKTITRKEDESRRLSGSGADHAWNLVEQMDCAAVYVYAMGQDPWVRHLTGLEYAPDAIQLSEAMKFVGQCKSAKIPAKLLLSCTEMTL